MDESLQIRIFGIRHHGPGCARSLVRAFEQWRPDAILVEGPPEGESVLPLAADEAMTPPVALLVYAEEDARRAAFYPFAEFSPEWQALRYALAEGVPVRFMDLPASVRFALEKREEEAERAAAETSEDASAQADGESPEMAQEGETRTAQSDAPEKATPEKESPDETGAEKTASNETGAAQPGSDGEDAEQEESVPFDVADPLDWLGRAAGYESGESWWNHMVEERLDGLELFEAIREAMTAVRQEREQRDGAASGLEALREAHMRSCLRKAKKEGFLRIAVVCGAWHVPALEAKVAARDDNALLKGLPKMKAVATWAPWTYAGLSVRSGYGAGVESPAWYEHLWRGKTAESRAVSWLASAARLFREEGLDCSPAHVIESARLAESLAALRHRPGAGLHELCEALQTVVCMGEEAPMRLIARRLITGEKLGRVPEGVPAVPLQRDIERLQKKLRLKPEASQKTLDLDLRKEVDLERSRMLHRMNLLDIPWGTDRREGGGKGTFHEVWQLQWEPKLVVDIIQAGVWGGTLLDAAVRRTLDRASRANLPELAALMDAALLADLGEAVEGLVRTLENLAALTTDTLQLLRTLPELVRVARYGDVRGTDTGMVLALVDGMVPRVAVGLHAALSGLNAESSAELAAPLRAAHEAIRLSGREELALMWRQALRRLLAEESGVHAVLRGLAARLLFDDEALSLDEVASLMSLALSPASEPEESAGWLSSFLGESAMVLLHDDMLWSLVDQWLTTLPAERFKSVLPMLRRTFTEFSAPERRQLAERARRAPGSAAASAAQSFDRDEARAALPLPFLRKILGLAAPHVGENERGIHG